MDPHSGVSWDTFIIRISLVGRPAAWLSEAVHVQSRTVRRFENLAECEAFVLSFAPGLDPGPQAAVAADAGPSA